MAKISVFLDDGTHKKAKNCAHDSKQSLSEWVAELIAQAVSVKKAKVA